MRLKRFLISAQISANTCPFDERPRATHYFFCLFTFATIFFFFLANNALDQGSFEEIKKNETRLMKTKPFMT